MVQDRDILAMED